MAAQPRPLLCFMGAVALCAIVLAVTAAASAPVLLRELAAFAALLLCSALCIEAMRRLGSPTGVARDLLGAWWFPVVLLLPPLYSLLMPVPVYLLLQFRVRRTMLFRRVFNAVSVALSGFIASTMFQAAIAAGLVQVGGHAVRTAEQVLMTGPGVLLAALCCTVFTVLNTATVAVAVRLSTADLPWRKLLWDREALLVDAVELCVGITVAILSELSLSLLLIALPPTLLLQRTLLFQQLQAAARTDPKTGLLNAATWEQEAGAALARSLHGKRPLAVLIIDIDHFKRVNDTYGHLFGDHVLLGVANALTHQLRKSDMLGRFGGEEFVVVLPGADMAEACRVAERMRSRVGRMVLSTGGASVTITISIGVALLSVHGDDLIELLAAADLALYRAKDAGRDRVCLPITGPPMIPAQQKDRRQEGTEADGGPSPLRPSTG